MKCLYRLQAPRLSLLALSLGPGDAPPVGCQPEPRTSGGYLAPVAPWFVHVEKKGLLDCMLVGPGLDVNAILEKNIGGTKHILARIEREGDVVQAALGAGVVARVGKIVALVGRRHPHAGFAAIVEHDLLGQLEAEIVLEEFAVGLDVNRKPVEMVNPANIDAARGKTLRLVLERGPEFRRSLVPLGFVIDLEIVAVRILEHERLAMAEIAIAPADVETGAFQRGSATLQRLW